MMTVNLKMPMHKPITAQPTLDDNKQHDLLDEVCRNIKERVNPVIIDCSKLVRVNSSYINKLWMAYENCKKAGITLELINVNVGLRRVLDALDLSEFFLPQINSPIHFKQKFPPTTEAIDNAMDNIFSFLVNSGLPEIISFELQTIFYEVSTNVRRHGKLADESFISCEVEVSDKLVTIQFHDDGIPFDPTSGSLEINYDRASKTNQKNGFGLAMINRLSDSFEYSRTKDNKNIITITKKW